MAKDKKPAAPKTENGAKGGDENEAMPSIAINAQYVKDLSFENPKAPGSLIASKKQPKIDLTVDLKASAMNKEKGAYEVSMSLQAKASTDEEIQFLADLTYAGIFTLSNIPQKDLEPTLLIYCPTILFPFARRIISDITRDGGFPPLMLEPMDFGRLYMQRKNQGAEIKGQKAEG